MAQDALASFVAIQTLREEAGTDAAASAALNTLLLLAGNVLKNPAEPKYRHVKGGNKVFLSKVGLFSAGADLMMLLGFVREEGGWHMPEGRLPSNGTMRAMREHLSSETIQGRGTEVVASAIPDIGARDGDFTESDYEALLSLDEQPDVMMMRASPQRVIQGLVPTLAPAERTCYVCLEQIQPGTEAVGLACGDTFHPNCIRRWAAESRFCPICKESLA
eukprot:TRINITY_DN66476_c0_g1_i1.p1 TRINITY_DN66476_c0_g1~~TRINITY_DN66476_c0_g1_i1.p1  ORF type:complete len:233 (+),score=71.42 TRINITY_DN66476_c0_g1_i1:44-700(+)